MQDTTYYWRVRAKSPNSTGEWSVTRRFTIKLETLVIEVSAKWNMVAIPLSSNDMSKSSLFPTSISPAYAFVPDSGYRQRNSLTTTLGYWLEFPSDQSISLSGFRVDPETIAVEPGWNLVGSLSKRIPVSSIVSDPPGLITGEFFTYAQQYHPTDTLEPGKGCWVMVSDAAHLILSSNPFASPSARIKTLLHSEPPPPPPLELDRVQTMPVEYSLEQNYPNPFNPKTVIRYSLAVNSSVSLKVYDFVGEEVATLVDGVKFAGRYIVEWNARDAPSGVYFCRLTSNSYSETRKLLLIR
jgi:hypothetical protein